MCVNYYHKNVVFIRVKFFLYYARLGLGSRTFLIDITRDVQVTEPVTPTSNLSNDLSVCCTVFDGVHKICIVWYQQPGENFLRFSPETSEPIATIPYVGRMDFNQLH